MTGPLAPVGILNLIRASLGIPPDSTFPENALAAPWRLSSMMSSKAMSARKAIEIIAPRVIGYRYLRGSHAWALTSSPCAHLTTASAGIP